MDTRTDILNYKMWISDQKQIEMRNKDQNLRICFRLYIERKPLSALKYKHVWLYIKLSIVTITCLQYWVIHKLKI